MSDLPNAWELREAARAIEKSNAAQGHADQLSLPEVVKEVHVRWHYASATPGYEDLAEAMSRVVRRRFNELMAEALVDLGAASDEAIRKLRSKLT